MPRPLQVLIVEDNPYDADVLVEQLRQNDFEPLWTRVDSERAYVEALRPDLDVIISDFSLPQFNGLRALELLKVKGYDLPFIIVSGVIDAETAVEAIKAGASDYLMKDRPERLAAAVSQALERRHLRRGYILAEQAAEEGERKFRLLFDGAEDSIYILYNGIFVDCNAKGLRMYGRTWDQIVGHTPDEFSPAQQPDGSNSREMAIGIVTRAMGGEAQSFEWTSLHSNGDPVVSDVSLNRLEMNGKIYLMAISRDITERRKTEDRLTELAALLDKAQDAIVARDLDSNIIFWNKGAERLYGWTKEEVLGRNITDFIYQDPALFEMARRWVIDNGEWTGELHHLTRDRRELMIEARWTLLRDRNGQPKSILAINTDVTDKREIESQLMRSQRMESIGTLAGGIAHDLNNILTPILTSIEILKLTETNPRAREILGTIEASSKRGADIVRQVLSFARGIKGERVEVQPKRLVKDLETLIRETFPKNIQLQLSVPNKCWSVLGDPTQLHQVLLNLAVNARDAMPDGGRLTIGVKNTTLNESECVKYLGADPGPYLVFTIADSGTGIYPDTMDKIFEPFYTTKDVGKGTGLGLSTVIAILKSHGGFVEVDSAVERGTIFHVFLPAMAAAPRTDEADSLTSIQRGSGETILLVDDEPSILTVTGDTLEAFGYEVLSAHDGTEAIELYRKHGDTISLVLTDMTMPNMDGPTTIRHLLEINPEVKIIASSGFMTSEGASRISTAKMKNFLAKPYSAEALLRTVRMALKEDELTPIA
jgi:PAS domain S-box-containing protein